MTVEAQTGRWVFDPFVVLDEASNQRYIFYGSYVGGISARKLSNDGLTSDKASETRIAVADRYEGSFIRRMNGYYYLFASSTNCCNDHLTGYSIFVGRSTNLLGPYVDREGSSFLDARVGGTPVISMNGNRWTGPGHNSILTDFGGQDWMVYHAVNRSDPYFAGSPGFTKRAALLDPLDWVGPDANNLWPTVRGGLWASETADPATLKPAAQPGSATTYTFEPATMDTPGMPIASLSDNLDGSTLGSQWSWVREPTAGTAGLTGSGAFAFNTQAADLHKDQNNASVFLEPEPLDSTTGAPLDYVLETKVQLTVPASGSGYNYVQAGLVIYGDDNKYVKLVHAATNGTRQTEFAKADIVNPGPRFGNTVVGAPAEWTYLRLVKRTDATSGEQEYTAYTSRDGANWVRGGTWTHTLDSNVRIGLVSMGGAGYIATFDYVRVSTVTP